MEDLIKQYLRTLDTTTIDAFRVLIHKSCKRQINQIQERHSNASGLNKDLINDEGVQANMIRWLGDELILISLYHELEKKLKETIKHFEADSLPTLSRWDDIKKHIPCCVTKSYDYQQVNILRSLVNCFKHAGVVSKQLNKLDPSFGEIGEEIISVDIGTLYDKYKSCASNVLEKTYEDLRNKRPTSSSEIDW